jgi:hypothetical protein
MKEGNHGERQIDLAVSFLVRGVRGEKHRNMILCWILRTNKYLMVGYIFMRRYKGSHLCFHMKSVLCLCMSLSHIQPLKRDCK